MLTTTKRRALNSELPSESEVSPSSSTSSGTTQLRVYQFSRLHTYLSTMHVGKMAHTVSSGSHQSLVLWQQLRDTLLGLPSLGSISSHPMISALRLLTEDHLRSPAQGGKLSQPPHNSRWCDFSHWGVMMLSSLYCEYCLSPEILLWGLPTSDCRRSPSLCSKDLFYCRTVCFRQACPYKVFIFYHSGHRVRWVCGLEVIVRCMTHKVHLLQGARNILLWA